MDKHFEPKKEASDEPPEPPEPPGNLFIRGLSRMVAVVTPNLSMCKGRESHYDYNCIFRKHLGIMGVIDFYPQK